MLLETAGLILGYGRSAALGLGLFVAGWALGAREAERFRRGLRRGLVMAGLFVAVMGEIAVYTHLLSYRQEPGLKSTLVGGFTLLAPAFFQGILLSFCVRAREVLGGSRGRIDLIWAANLLGAVVGAWVVADLTVGAFGRPAAVHLACAAAVVGALLVATAVPAGTAPRPPQPAGGAAVGGAGRAGLLLGILTAWMIGLEWVLLRLGVLWLGGMQDALAALLGATVVGLALGAVILPAPLRRAGAAAPGLLFVLAALASLWPAVSAGALDSAVGAGPFAFALLLVVPAVAPFGAAVPVLYLSLKGGGGDGQRLGRLLVHEAWGALLGAPLIHWLLVPQLGLAGALAALVLAGALAAAVLTRPRWLVPLAALPAALVLVRVPAPALASPPLANPAFTFQAFEEDADFAVSVVDDGVLGERTLLTDGFRAAGTGRDYRYMRALGHLPVLLHPEPRDVCVLALGTGTTVGAVSLHPEVERIDVLELSAAVVDQAPHFVEVNRGALEDPRVRVTVADGRRTLRGRRDCYDVITLEPLLPDSPFAVYLYTEEFYRAAMRALRVGGLLCQWVPPHALEPETFDAVVGAFRSSVPDAEVWLFGTQVVLIGGKLPAPQPADRLEQLPEALAAELTALGLGTRVDLYAHRVGEAWDLEPPDRPLTDADPWVIRRPRRSGLVLLGDLPLNLATLRAVETPPEVEFTPDESQALASRWLGQRALARAREARAVADLMARGGPPLDGPWPDLDTELGLAEEHLGPGHPSLVVFVDELRFLDALSLGVSRLGRGEVSSTLEPLTTAAELRPERGDVHLYLACALQRAGADAAAAAAWGAARERCPRILETPAGRRVLDLGFEAPGP